MILGVSGLCAECVRYCGVVLLALVGGMCLLARSRAAW